jgi:hypothetical protein
MLIEIICQTWFIFRRALETHLLFTLIFSLRQITTIFNHELNYVYIDIYIYIYIKNILHKVSTYTSILLKLTLAK